MAQSAVLVLVSLNETFERKQITIPFSPDRLILGRKFDTKTTPTTTNGFFDSKVLSKKHTEVWAEHDGTIWVRDLRSSNGTFVNGQRLPAGNSDSEPHELRQDDILELGVDIASGSASHHRVWAKVEYAGFSEDTL